MAKTSENEQLKIQANVDHLGELREFVTRIGKKYGYSERVVNAFKLSIDEAATNIIKHAYKEWDGDIIIRAVKRKSSLTFVLIDNGKYFDPRQFKDPDLQKYVDIGKKGGLGIFMMRRLLDRIDYKKTEEGNELWLTKNKQEKPGRPKITVSPIPLGLKARYWLFSMAAFTIVLVLVYLFFFMDQNQVVLSRYIEKAREACSIVGSDISENLIPDNDLITDEIIDDLVKNGSMDPIILDYTNTSIKNLLNTEYSDILLNAFVVDNIQNILSTAEYDSVYFRILSRFDIPGENKKLEENVYEYRLPSGEKVVDYTWQVRNAEDRTLCTLHFLIDYQIIQKEMNAARFSYLNLVLLVWVIGAAGLFLLIYLVMTPLKRLQDWVKTMNQPGDLEDLEIDTSTEVGEIAKAFSDITLKLRDSQANLAEQERLQKEMQVAQEIQQTLLPSEFPDLEGYDLASFYAAAKEVGGDYYDFVEVDQDTLGIVVADVSGKGVPGSLVMTMIRTALRTEARGVKDAAEVLTRVNDFVVNDMKKGMFVTLFYVIVDSKKRRINYASAGHNPMILYRASQKKTYYLNPKGFPIGISLPDKDLFKNSLESDSIALTEDDILIVYTDGVTEAMNTKRDLFGEERFLKVIQNNGDSTADEFVENLKSEIMSFTEGSPQNDDITLVAIKEQTSAEKLELKRAKDAYMAIQNGKSVKQACKEAGISTYSYYNKYKTRFEENELDDVLADEPSEEFEVKQLSIEEKTKIYDVIKRFPEFGAKRISEELNSEHYENTVISPAKIYDELVSSRLNTKKLREGFIARGNRQKRMKPPGTPMLTIDGKIIVNKPKPEPRFELPEPVETERHQEVITTGDIFNDEKPQEEEILQNLEQETETVDSAEGQELDSAVEETHEPIQIEEMPLEDVLTFEDLTDFSFDVDETFNEMESELTQAPEVSESLNQEELSVSNDTSDDNRESDALKMVSDTESNETEDIESIDLETDLMGSDDIESHVSEPGQETPEHETVIDDSVEEPDFMESIFGDSHRELLSVEEPEEIQEQFESEMEEAAHTSETVLEDGNKEPELLTVDDLEKESDIVETLADDTDDESLENIFATKDTVELEVETPAEQPVAENKEEPEQESSLDEQIEQDDEPDPVDSLTVDIDESMFSFPEEETESSSAFDEFMFDHDEDTDPLVQKTETETEKEQDAEAEEPEAGFIHQTEATTESQIDDEIDIFADVEEVDDESLFVKEEPIEENDLVTNDFFVQEETQPEDSEIKENRFDVMDIYDPEMDSQVDHTDAITHPFKDASEPEQFEQPQLDEQVFESISDDSMDSIDDQVLEHYEDNIQASDENLSPADIVLGDEDDETLLIDTNNPLIEIHNLEEEPDVTDLGVEGKYKPRDVEQEERDLIDMLDSNDTLIEEQETPEQKSFYDQHNVEEADVISESSYDQTPPAVQPFDDLVKAEHDDQSDAETVNWEDVKDDFDFSISYDDIWEIKEMKPETRTGAVQSAGPEENKMSFEELIELAGKDDKDDGSASYTASSSPQNPNVQHEKDQLFRDKLMTKAIKLYEKEEYTEAIQVFLELKKKHPQDYKVHGYLGNAYFHNKQYSKAAVEYEQVLQINENNIQACENLGVVYANQGNLSKAIQQWEKLLTISPERIDIKKSIERAKKYLNKMV